MGPAGAGGSMSMATMNPAFLNLYMSVIFTYAFSSGGYEVTPVAYKSGDYTRWSGQGQDGKGVTVERAYLGDDAKGRQWWKVKFTDDAEGKEMPLDESNYYHPAQRLSEDSVEGATKGVEKVTVPAGTFTARHVVFGGIDGTHEWWLDMKIPGGTVRQLVKSAKSDKDKWDMQLAAYGSDAKSELGSK